MVTTEEYAIYTAVCRSDLYNLKGPPDAIFKDRTACEPHSRAPLDHLGGPFRYRCLKHPKLVQDFAIKNQTPWPLEKRFEVATGFKLLSERCPGQFRLSRVGFTPDVRLGLVYLAYSGGRLIGAGHFLLFERTGPEWTLARWLPLQAQPCTLSWRADGDCRQFGLSGTSRADDADGL